MNLENKSYLVHYHMNTIIPDYRVSDPVILDTDEQHYVVNALLVANEFDDYEKHLVRIDRFEISGEDPEILEDDLL